MIQIRVYPYGPLYYCINGLGQVFIISHVFCGFYLLSKNKIATTGNSKWNQYEPNGLDFEQCVDTVIYNGTEVWNDELCGSLRCSLCKMPISQKYYLRGQSEYDQEYSLSMNLQKNASKIVFEGQGRDQIFWHVSESKTEIKRSASKNLEFDQLPFGRLISKSNGQHDWVFTNVGFSN